MDPIVALALCFCFLIPVFLVQAFFRRRSSLIRGPPRESWLFGNERELGWQHYAAVAETKWTKAYGNVVSIGYAYGHEGLLVSDPKALHHIIHASGYRYPKSDDMHHTNSAVFGDGLVTVEGDMHRRHRRILNAAFSVSQLKSYMGVIHSEIEKTSDRLKAAVGQEGVVEVSAVFSKTALNIAGLAFFGYDFEAFDGQNEMARKLSNITEQAMGKPTMVGTLFLSAWRVFPKWYLNGVAFLLSKGTPYGILQEFQKLSRRIAGEILTKAADIPCEKDIVGILGTSLTTPELKYKLSKEEVLAQFGTFITAAQDTTSSTIAFLLHEFSLNPADQARVRAEITDLLAKKQGEPPTSADYDSLPYLNACIKESLRIHPVSPVILRKPTQDDVLPLSEPLELANGQMTLQVPVRKGQTIYCSGWLYNRHPLVWGDDAEEWNPSRFISGRRETEVSIGVMSNLLSFSGGVRGCIGWRFALAQIQAVCAQILRNFELQPAATIKEATTSITVFPIVEGKKEDGVALPLKFKLLE